MTAISRIVFCGDMFRPGPSGEHDVTNHFVSALHAALAPILAQATAHRIEAVSTGTAPGKINQNVLYDTLDRPFTLSSWAPIFRGTLRLEEGIGHLLERYLSGALVIGFELPASLINWLDERSIPYIQIVWSPLQFMDDFSLCLRSNNHDINARLVEFALEKPAVRTYAGIVRASMERAEVPAVERDLDNVLLVCANTATDRHLVEAEGLITFRDFTEIVHKICSEHDYILFKPHPWGMSTRDEREFFSQFPNVYFTTTNIYALMSRVRGLQTVLSLCSSASVEAEYFGLRGINLVCPPAELMWDNNPTALGLGAFVSVLHVEWRVSFWRRILEPVLSITGHNARELPPRANRWRNITAYGPAAAFELLPQHRAIEQHFLVEKRLDNSPKPTSSRLAKEALLRALTGEGAYEEALRLALSFRELDRLHAELHFRIGQCLFTLDRDRDEGITALDAAERLGCQERFWLVFFRGALHSRQGHRAAALKDLEEARTINPDHQEARAQRRGIRREILREMTQNGAYEEALGLAVKLLRDSDPEDGEIHFRIGQCLFTLDRDREQGISALHAAERLGFPEQFWVSYFRGALEARQGRLAPAIADLRTATELNPDHHEASELMKGILKIAA